MKLFRLVTFCVCIQSFSLAYGDFSPEKVGEIEMLPSPYPDHWVIIRDFGALALSIEGRHLVVDPLGKSLKDQFKGMMTASFAADLLNSPSGDEYYVVETFWSRGGRGGERTDVVSIYDPMTLAVVDEIYVPPRRITGMPKRSNTGLINSGRFLAIYSFSPSQDALIVDLRNRRYVNKIPLAGCGLVIPNGELSFTSVCADGSLQTTHLKIDGTLKDRSKVYDVFNPIEDPIFEAPAIFDDMAYFLTYKGTVVPIDVSKEKVTVKTTWKLSDSDNGWRPGGINQLVEDSSGLVYMLMHPDGDDGTHDNGGSEIWVFDMLERKRLSRIALESWGIAMGTSGSDGNRLLFVTNINQKVDTYRIPDGRFLKTLDVGAQAPLVLQGVR